MHDGDSPQSDATQDESNDENSVKTNLAPDTPDE